MTTDQLLAEDLRRIVYQIKLMQFITEAMMQSRATPHFMKECIRGMQNANKRFMTDCRARSPQAWDIIKKELNGDNVPDMALLIEKSMYIRNIPDLIEYIDEITVKA